MAGIEVVFWDVQHGHATYIKTPNGRDIVIDLGTGSYENGDDFSPLKHLKKKYSVSFLDFVIITHPHRDHIDDILEFDNLSPKVLLSPKHIDRGEITKNITEKDKPLFIKYFEIQDRYSEDLDDTSPYQISNPENWGGVEIYSFVPYFTSESNINNYSIVMAFIFQGLKVVIPGDNEQKSWQQVKQNSYFMNAIKNADILLAPHHGRDSGFDSEVMKHINPLITVISDSRFLDTSSTSRYSNITRGWTVHKRNGEDVDRKCLSTRNDGVIIASLGLNGYGSKYLSIKVD